MRRWIGGTSPVWPSSSWQVYALPRTPQVQAVAASYRPAITQFAELSPVAEDDLHMTVQPLPGWASDYNQQRLDQVVAALRAALAAVPPVTVTVGGAVCGSAGVVLDADADDQHPLQALYQRVHRVVATTVGDPPASSWPGHISLAYATESRDSGDVQSKLRRTRTAPIRAEWTISSLHLVNVHQDPDAHTYTWPTDTALEIPLGGRR